MIPRDPDELNDAFTFYRDNDVLFDPLAVRDAINLFEKESGSRDVAKNKRLLYSGIDIPGNIAVTPKGTDFTVVTPRKTFEKGDILISVKPIGTALSASAKNLEWADLQAVVAHEQFHIQQTFLKIFSGQKSSFWEITYRDILDDFLKETYYKVPLANRPADGGEYLIGAMYFVVGMAEIEAYMYELKQFGEKESFFSLQDAAGGLSLNFGLLVRLLKGGIPEEAKLPAVKGKKLSDTMTGFFVATLTRVWKELPPLLQEMRGPEVQFSDPNLEAKLPKRGQLFIPKMKP